MPVFCIHRPIASVLFSVDLEAVQQMPGVVQVVRNGSFLAVIAEREDVAVQAREHLSETAHWEQFALLPSQDELYDHMLNQEEQLALIVNNTPSVEPIPPVQLPDDAAQTLSATYKRPYQMHASLGPSAAMALWEDNQLTVWSHTQGVFNLQVALAKALGLEKEQVHVIHMEGAGCYGHNGADDAGLDAALLAQAVPGRPVLLKWMREDEHRWEPYGSAMVIQLNASLNSVGQISDWNYDVWSYTHLTRARPTDDGINLLAAWHLDPRGEPTTPQLLIGPEFGSHRNATPKYDFPRQRLVKHFLQDSPLRVSALRSLGAYANIFAIESFMDELAEAADCDPLEFRVSHLSDQRAIEVLQAAAEKAGWQSRARSANTGHGQGIAFAQYKNKQGYAAIVVNIHVNPATGEITLEEVVIAADVGQVVNPDGLSNQLEGGFVQAASWTLLEEVKFDEQGITSTDWESYPILRFKQAPVIQTVILNRPGSRFLGSGEITQNPTPAAIANAVYDAVGVRLRQIPFTPERVLEALKEQTN